jgi:hypothetical protein
VQGLAGPTNLELRQELLRFVAVFANWNNAANPIYLDAARALVRAAHGQEAPLLVDPFAGGGAIPLEGLRVGCDVLSSDLNPVACLIQRVVLQDIPRVGVAIGEQLRALAANIETAAKSELKHFYPKEGDGSTPIAYLWARTIICDSCGAEVPLLRSFWLCKKSKRRIALRCSVIRRNASPELEFEVFRPKNDSEVPLGTIKRAKATCAACQKVMPPDRVRMQLTKQSGGSEVVFDVSGKRTSGARLLAVVSVDEKLGGGRKYRVGLESDYEPVRRATEEARRLADDMPNEPLPPHGTLGFRVQLYGMTNWGQLFTARQKLALSTIARLGSAKSNDQETRNLFALCFSKMVDMNNSLTSWQPHAEIPAHMLTRFAVPMKWDFAEAVPISDSSGTIESATRRSKDVIPHIAMVGKAGQVQLASAVQELLPQESAAVWFTDPPYYDAVPYADISDFFLVWLKRILVGDKTLRDPYDSTNDLSPKTEEIVQDESRFWKGHTKDKKFFEEQMSIAFALGRRSLIDNGIGCVVFAHKTTEGWEALLSGMVNGGWTITGSWPLATEMSSRLRARESAALATSVHLVCRPRPDDSLVGDWATVLSELPDSVGKWIARLQSEGIRGADLVFACIGPAMEIYSRYRSVEDAEGRSIPLGGDPTAVEPYKRGFLSYVWETVGRLALEEVLGTAEARVRNGGAGALEEDSRLTALFLWTLQANETDSAEARSSDGEDEPEEGEDEDAPSKRKSGYNLIYDVARRFAQPLGIHLDKWEGRIIETEKGIVRLIPVAERGAQLFGEADAAAISRRIEADVKASRNYSFAFMQDAAAAPEIRTRRRGRKEGKAQTAAVVDAPAPQPVTTLDRLHAAMLLQRGGQTNGLRAMLREETQRGPDFLRLANALSRLYPKDSEEKRLLDAMLLATPRN